MPRCHLCDEWAGPDKDVHDQCLLALKLQVNQPSLLKRIFRRLGRGIRILVGAVSGSTARTN